MIIISQDRTRIINLDNIVYLEADCNGNILCLDTLANNYKDAKILAQYHTVERAKEIFKAIIEFYTRMDIKDQQQPVDKAIAITLMRDRAAFWMPEE